MSLSATLDEALCAFEAYRRLGFSAEQIFFTLSTTHVLSVLRTQDNEFAIICGSREGYFDSEVLAQWQERANWWNSPSTTEAERMRLWKRSYVFKHAFDLSVALTAKGIVVPPTAQA